MIYRFVCRDCTAYVKSPSTQDFKDLNDFNEEWTHIMDSWNDEHICGHDDGDGIENPEQFAGLIE